MLDVIGAGYGRTGTSSLKLALEILGFGKCYHFTEMARAGHVSRWLAITRGERADWDALFRGFRSTTDFPAAAYYRELAAHYRDAKVILTIRDAEAWYESVRGTLWPLRRAIPMWFPPTRRLADLTDAVLWDGALHGEFGRAHAVSTFERHVETVKAEIDPERLLVFDVREGWAPLCAFLGVPIPDVVFPHVNGTRHMRRVMWLVRGIHLFLLASILGSAVWFAIQLVR